jgi:hypothetical protein
MATAPICFMGDFESSQVTTTPVLRLRTQRSHKNIDENGAIVPDICVAPQRSTGTAISTG